MDKRRVTILGSTGSVGVSTLDLLAQTGAQVELAALTAGKNVTLLAEQALKWRPDAAVIADESLLPELQSRLSGSGVKAQAGQAAIVEAAGGQGANWVMAAIVGVAGLKPTLAAARAGAVVALANKESLVCAGPALLRAAKQAGGAVIPVDSEHSAIFQCLQPNWSKEVSRLILTASGGPFRDWSTEQMAHATPEQAIAHPNWSMGAKISVDCATLMNKSLEMIEAAYLFETAEDRIDVLVHRQSVIHSMVEYADGSTLAQLGPPDMRAPIAYAFAWPDRIAWPAQRLDLAAVGSLTFEPPDPARFPSLDLARHALRAGGGAPAAFNAANETAVARFLDRKIGFLDIVAAVAETLERMDAAGDLQARGEQETADGALEFALSIDGRARQVAAEATERLAQVV